jgi:hypothetical protein
MDSALIVDLLALSEFPIRDTARLSCALEKSTSNHVAICQLEIASGSIAPGQHGRARMQVIPNEAMETLRKAKTFYLKSGPLLVAEATIRSE